MDKKRLTDAGGFLSFIEDDDHMIGLDWINFELFLAPSVLHSVAIKENIFE